MPLDTFMFFHPKSYHNPSPLVRVSWKDNLKGVLAKERGNYYEKMYRNTKDLERMIEEQRLKEM